MRRWLPTVLAIILLAGAIVCLYIIATAEISARESLMLGFIMSAVSFIASWILAHAYSEDTFNRNLRTFALKAAEKVNNLSNELDRLSLYLLQQDDLAEIANQSELLRAKDMRIEAAVHNINTLKSMNDRSLSDWQGVIGDELIAQKEERESREEEFRDIVERVEALLDGDTRNSNGDIATKDSLVSDIASLRNDLRLVASQVSGIPVKKPRLSGRQSVELKCPVCGNLVKYEQRIKTGGHRGLNCNFCKAKLVSFWEGDHFNLIPNEPREETISCPGCATNVTALLAMTPGQTTDVKCETCDQKLRLSRYQNKARVKIVQKPSGSDLERIHLTPEILAKVKDAMPPQPWASGASKVVAEELGIDYPIVRGAVQILVAQGVFKLQKDGKVYEEIKPKEITSGDDLDNVSKSSK